MGWSIHFGIKIGKCYLKQYRTTLAVQRLEFRLSIQGYRFDPWLRSYDLTCLVAKKKKRSNTVTNSIQTLENDPHQKNKQINRSKARGMDDVTWGKNVEIERNLV